MVEVVPKRGPNMRHEQHAILGVNLRRTRLLIGMEATIITIASYNCGDTAAWYRIKIQQSVVAAVVFAVVVVVVVEVEFQKKMKASSDVEVEAEYVIPHHHISTRPRRRLFS
ncbi:hypothetical protein FPQ18DRAFT_308317 [Pyronema domesticum]|nr:hypothetical protein FPQ18DRAFT_308317 [Pyronema domesticum]